MPFLERPCVQRRKSTRFCLKRSKHLFNISKTSISASLFANAVVKCFTDSIPSSGFCIGLDASAVTAFSSPVQSLVWHLHVNLFRPLSRPNVLCVLSIKKLPPQIQNSWVWHKRLGQAGPDALASLIYPAENAKLRGPTTVFGLSKMPAVISRRPSRQIKACTI